MTMTRRQFLGAAASVGAMSALGITGLDGFRGLGRMAAAAALDGPPVLPGQVGDAVAYTTALGTPAWMAYVYAGEPADNHHFAKVALPAAFDPTTPTPTVLVLHGASATEECITLGPAMRRVTESWLDLGWAVVSARHGSTPVRFGRGTWAQWGNQPSRVGMLDAWHWVQSAWTPDPHGFCVFGISMGAAAALNYANEAQRAGAPVAAVYSVDGTTNLRACDAGSKSFHKFIRAAYTLPWIYVAGDESWVARVDEPDGGHDPQRFMTALRPFPLRLSASASDSVVNKANNSALLQSTLIEAGWPDVSMRDTSLGHNAASHFKASDTNPFFLDALARPIEPVSG